MLSEHQDQWLGYPVKLFDPKEQARNYAGTIHRLACEWDDEQSLVDRFAQFLEDPASVETPAIIFGLFGDHDFTSAPLVEALVAARQRLPKLRGVFLGDIVSEENEISWIHQSDVSPLFQAYPALEHFRVRGNDGLTLGRLRHAQLKSLVVETGGLSATAVRDVMASNLPSLEHLELWLGTANYGWDGSVTDLHPLLESRLFPKLKYLGLRDSEIADDVAAAVAAASVLDGLEVLDLSLGTLGDGGAEALLSSPWIKSLRKLDLHYHFITSEVAGRLQALGIEVDLSEAQASEGVGLDDRYVSVSE